MQNYQRSIGATAGGALMAALIGLAMIKLIAAEFVAEEKFTAATFDINSTVEDVELIDRETKVQQMKKVITPPPPPQIERQPASKPTEAISSVKGAIPKFDAPKIDREILKIAVSDRDAQPLVRISPIMPPRAEKSGHCKVRFDVSSQGLPFNVSATYCTQDLFKSASLKSVQKWKYNPKIVDGRSVSRTGVESKITFRLSDEGDNLIPE